jgi:hypothetical protein
MAAVLAVRLLCMPVYWFMPKIDLCPTVAPVYMCAPRFSRQGNTKAFMMVRGVRYPGNDYPPGWRGNARQQALAIAMVAL